MKRLTYLLTGLAPLALVMGCMDEPVPASEAAGRATGGEISELETWQTSGDVTVENCAGQGGVVSRDAARIAMGPTAVLAVASTRDPVAAGESVGAAVWLWSEEPVEIALQLVRWCSETPSEVATKWVTLGETPQLYSISHTFAHDHDCFRFQLASGQVPIAIYARAVLVEKFG